ncbi:hypothetical protein E4U41_000794 [Claviceps citrina]|nr:hypothetical protein E4U41_000794 [Claviceps citrina]
MIDPQYRFLAGSGSLLTGGSHTWYITDFDQRRCFSVTYAPPVPPGDDDDAAAYTEELCIAQLKKHVDELGEGVYRISFSEPDGPITISTDLIDDVTLYVNYPSMAELKVPFPLKTVYLQNLTELDRLCVQVDLVSYQMPPHVGKTSPKKTVVFKYWFFTNNMFRGWNEINIWSRLPCDHPHIVPLDSIVLDKISGGIVGITTPFISGGTLHETNATTRPFRLQWLHQLLSVVDDLNYQYGVVHQDLAARNLLIDEHDNLRVFDFNHSRIYEWSLPGRDDVTGVIYTLYEIITLDTHFREVPLEQQDVQALLQMEWVKHPDVQLDSDVKTFLDVLDVWLTKRKSRKVEAQDTWIDWDATPNPPPGISTFDISYKSDTEKKMGNPWVVSRRTLVESGKPFWNWERPASHLLRKDVDKSEVVNKEEVIDKEEVVDKEVMDKKVMDKEVTDKEVMDKKEVVDKGEVANKEEVMGKGEVVDKEEVVGKGVMGKGEVFDEEEVVDKNVMDKEEIVDNGEVVDKGEVMNKGEVANKEEVVGKEVMGKGEVFDEEVVDKEEVLDKKVLDKKVLDKEVLDKEVLDKEVLDKEVLDKEVLDKEVLDKEVHAQSG